MQKLKDYFGQIFKQTQILRLFICGQIWLHLLVLMSIQRWIFYVVNSADFPSISVSEMTLVIIAGLRFDLLILGFWWAGFILLSNAFSFEKSHLWKRLGKIWLTAGWAVLSALGILNLIFYHRYFEPISHEHLTLHHWDFSTLWGLDLANGVAIVCYCLIAIGGMRVQKKFNDIDAFPPPPPESWVKAVFAILIPILSVLIMARGSLGNHHLETAHSQVTEHAAWNEWILPPAYLWDK